jgi:flagellar basal-body rod protein FlgG
MQAGKPLIQYTLRELALCMAIVGLALGWCLDHRRLQGHLNHTGNSLDVAIDGEGLFQLSDHATSFRIYTTCGSFSIDDNGLLVADIHGVKRLIDPQISIPNSTIGIAINPDGLVLVQVADKSQLQPVGQIQLSVFDDPGKLRRVADCVYAETVESGSPRSANPGTYGAGRVLQGVLDRRSSGLFGLKW